MLHKKGNLQQCQTDQTITGDQPCQPSKQSQLKVILEAKSREYHHWRTGRLQSRKENHRADLQTKNPLWEASPALARPISCLHRFEEGFWQSLACSFVSSHEELQHQHQPYRVIKHLYDEATSTVLFNRSTEDWFWTTAGVQQWCLLSPTLFKLHISGKDHDAIDGRLTRSWRYCHSVSIGGRTITFLMTSNDWWLSRKGRRTGKISSASWQSLHSIWHGGRCWGDQAVDKQHQ